MNAGFGAFCKVLRPNKEIVNENYFKFYFETPHYKNTISQLAEGANINNLKTEHFDNLEIYLPPIETQQKIAAILDAADTLRQKDKALVAKYDELTQALFLDMFGDVITNNKNWESKKFEEIISLKRGYDLPNNDRKKGDIPVVASTGIVGYHNEVKVKGGCIVTGRSGSIGKVQLITVDCWPLNTSLYGYKTFNNNLVYLKYFVSYFRIERFSHGAGVPTLDRKLVHKELAPLPPIELQHLFAERINAIEQQKAIAQASLEKSEELFNSLLQKAFKGELV
jgi:type I restriction enzyme S subunit